MHAGRVRTPCCVLRAPGGWNSLCQTTVLCSFLDLKVINNASPQFPAVFLKWDVESYSTASTVFFWGFEDHLVVFLHLMTSFLYKMGGASPPYSSFSPLILGPFLKPKDVTFIHSSPIQLMRTKILLEIVLGLGGAR